MAPAGPGRHLPNPGAAGRAPYPPALRRLLSTADTERARTTMAAWPGYAATPLHALDEVAAGLGVASVHCKDESGRFGLGSFKALGGAYAVFHVLLDHLRAVAGVEPDPGALLRGAYRDRVADVTVCAATAGNHGRSVAWGAGVFGCRAVIYVPAATAPERVAAIAGHGAEVVRVEGTYDDTVRRAAADAAARGWRVVADTAYAGYTEIPRRVMQGYTVLADEIVRRWPAADPPTHVFLQCGVGGLAAAVCAHFWERWGARRPRCVVVEPERAACMHTSVRAGRPRFVPGPLVTTMHCLACAEPSLHAWAVLAPGADDLLTVTDAEAAAAAARLEDAGGRPPLRTTPSGAAGFAGLVVAARHPELRRALGLDDDSRVVVVVSEGR